VKLILVYSSIYANVTSDGLYELINTESLDFGDIKLDVDLPQINFDKFERDILISRTRMETATVTVKTPDLVRACFQQ